MQPVELKLIRGMLGHVEGCGNSRRRSGTWVAHQGSRGPGFRHRVS